MNILRVSKDGVLLLEQKLTDAPVFIGRDPENDIRLGDLTVSRRHACITPDLDGHFLVDDLSSSNGVLLNDRKVRKRELLRSGDIVKIGVYQLSYFEELQTKEITLQRKKPEPDRVDYRQTTIDASSGGILVNETNNAIFTINKDKIALGNDGEVDIRVPAPERILASITKQGSRFYICSETDQPCVQLNGEFVMNAQLSYNDRIEIGDRRFIFREI